MVCSLNNMIIDNKIKKVQTFKFLKKWLLTSSLPFSINVRLDVIFTGGVG